MTSPISKIPAFLLLSTHLMLGATAARADVTRCLEEAVLPRLARALPASGGGPVWVRVIRHREGVPTEVTPLAPASLPLGDALARAGEPIDPDAEVWKVSDDGARLCTPVPLTQEEIDAEARVVVAAGLNYAAHAEEAGGGDVFFFPKPVAPGAPYAAVSAPAGVTLLDYEVELGFVLLHDIYLGALPSRETLLAGSAFFVSNDLTDREPIIVHKALLGPGTGFVEAKGQPGFLPAGPWLVQGSALFEAASRCGAEGLGLRLEVDEGAGFLVRQDETTAAMILDPHALLARIAEEVEREGPRSPMPVVRNGEVRHYPIALEDDEQRMLLPAGSIVLTGTPEGVALQAPSAPAVLVRGLANLRGPLEQFRHEQLERAARGEPGGYLAPGDRVRARIDGLGTQVFQVAEPGSPLSNDPCASTAGGSMP